MITLAGNDRKSLGDSCHYSLDSQAVTPRTRLPGRIIAQLRLARLQARQAFQLKEKKWQHILILFVECR
jgi:hypothetical protein